MSTKANWIGTTDYKSKISKMQDKGRVNVKKEKVNSWRKLTKSTWSKRKETEQEMKMKITVKILKIKLTSRKGIRV